MELLKYHPNRLLRTKNCAPLPKIRPGCILGCMHTRTRHGLWGQFEAVIQLGNQDEARWLVDHYPLLEVTVINASFHSNLSKVGGSRASALPRCSKVKFIRPPVYSGKAGALAKFSAAGGAVANNVEMILFSS